MNHNILFCLIIFVFVKFNHATINSSMVTTSFFYKEKCVVFHLSTSKDNTYKIADSSTNEGVFYKGNPNTPEPPEDVNKKFFDFKQEAVISTCVPTGMFSVKTYNNTLIAKVTWKSNTINILNENVKKVKFICIGPDNYPSNEYVEHIYISCYYVDV